jgi:hypothetical protein
MVIDWKMFRAGTFSLRKGTKNASGKTLLPPRRAMKRKLSQKSFLSVNFMISGATTVLCVAKKTAVDVSPVSVTRGALAPPRQFVC